MQNARLGFAALTLGALPGAFAAAAQDPAAAPPTPDTAAAIRVTVNGSPVAFAPPAAPVQQNGTVLVPLRGVFEKLGANVQYDAATKTIVAVKGPTTVRLTLGADQADVNGETRTLSVPALATQGTTLVPLRFVSEALGAQVKWQATDRTVVITTDAQVAEKLPAPAGTGPVTGTLTGVFPESRTITVRIAGGRNTQITLASDVLVLARGGSGNAPATEADLNTLGAGDQVTVRRDGDGRAARIEVSVAERRGEVKSVARVPSSGNFRITLTDGGVVEVAPDVPVTQAGRPVALSDVKAGERVVIRTNPQTNQGVGIAIVTGDNPVPAPPGNAKVEVTSFTQNAPADRPLRANETLTITLSGTPGGAATFSLSGVESAQNLPLKESAPGTYVGTFTIPPGLNVGGAGAAVAGQLTVGGSVSPVVQAGLPVRIDAAGPTLASLSPAPDATVPPARPLIYGTYADPNGTGVSAQTVRLLVNNEDVTARATITDAFFSYPPPADLPGGKNTVVVTLRDAAGNETHREWSFTVTPAEILLKRVTFTPENKTLLFGDTLTVRAEAAPGGTARFLLGGGPAAAIERPMREESPGVYVGTYEVKRGDALTRALVRVTFTAPGGAPAAAVTLAASQAVTIAAGAPGTPIIDTPQEGASVGAAVVTLTGRAAPGATVRVNVSYQGRAVLVIGARGRLAEREVKADAQGKWSVENVKLSAPPGVANLSFTATAVSVDPAGEASAPATVRFRR